MIESIESVTRALGASDVPLFVYIDYFCVRSLSFQWACICTRQRMYMLVGWHRFIDTHRVVRLHRRERRETSRGILFDSVKLFLSFIFGFLFALPRGFQMISRNECVGWSFSHRSVASESARSSGDAYSRTRNSD